jgi:soluble lytic murein transglycosylase
MGLKQLAVIIGCLIAFSSLAEKSTRAVSKNTSLKSNLSSKQLDFIQAEEALKEDNTHRFNVLYRSLNDYPLQEYLHRDRLTKDLSRGSPPIKLNNEIKDFLYSHRNQVVSRKLRYQWLRYLADTRQVEPFLKYYQPSGSINLKCRYLQFRLQQQSASTDISAEVETIWLTGSSLPDACNPLIKLWQRSGGLTQPLIWQRMLLAADQKQYRLISYLNNKRTKLDQTSGELLIKIMQRPEKLLSIKFKPQISKHDQTIIFKGLNKLAWRDAAKAIKTWKKFDQRLTLSQTQLETLKRSIGLSLAIEQQPDAKDWLISLNSKQDASVDQWLLSSALNTQDWSLIEYITRQKNHLSIDVDKWRYWRAISTKNIGFAKTSDWLLKSLASNRSYYGFLAAIDQQQQPQLNINSEKIPAEVFVELSNRRNAINAFEFYQMGRLTEARSEWNALVRSSAQTELVALAQLAHSWGWQHQSILAFAKSKQIDDVKKRFPFYQNDLYANESSKNQIPISWAYAITRQESAFKEDASSGAGAQGLMQLTPSTARRVAKRQAKSNYIAYKSKTQLHSAEINIKLGTAHLKEVLDHYQGNPILATAAYNAGSHRVDMWLRNNNTSDSILWIEQIPYKETREYVKNVLTYQQIYSQLSDSSDSFLSNLSNYPIPVKNNANSQMSAH